MSEEATKLNKKSNQEEKEEEEHYTSKKHLSQHSEHIYLLPTVLMVVGIICYLITLTGCEGTQADCLKNFDQTKIKYFVMIMITGCIAFTLNYIILIYKKNNISIAVLQTVVILYLCFVHDTGSDLKNHGSYNRIFLALLMLICFILSNVVMLIYFLMRRKIFYTIIFLAVTIGALSAVIYVNLITQCKNWEKGLKDSVFDNSSDYCKIKKPRKCWMNLFSGVFDVSGIFGEDCTQIRMDSRSAFKRWTKIPEAKILGYPRIEKTRYFPECTLDEFQFRVLSGMIDMEDPKVSQSIKDRTEAVINFKKELPELTVKVARDDYVAKERLNTYEKRKDKLLSKNVIHFFIDSLSRDNFRRQLPKTKAFFERFYRNDASQAQIFQFFKYHGIASWTLANMVPIFFGVDFTYRKNPPPTHYNKYFKEAGFVTGQGHGYCGKEIFDLEPGNMEKFNFEFFDHEINPIYCDPNFSVPGHPFAILNGPYAMKRRCLYGKDTHTYIFDYVKSFWEQYEKEPKFFRLAFQDAHEGTGEVIKYMDDKIVDLFQFLESKGSLEDTIIVFHSDHGVNMPGFYTFVDAEDFQIEKSLPTFFLFLPQNVAQMYKDQLISKENMLVTPYDIHNTFLEIINAPSHAFNKIGGSLFGPINEKKRDCDTFNIRDPFCNCLGERDNPTPEEYYK